jgi:hypothetical protein
MGKSDGKRVTGGNRRRVQVRRAPRGSFGEAARQVFLDYLASCANVTAAAAAAGVGVSTVYDARRSDPFFRQQWEEAIEMGYATLEALLLERAAKGRAYVPGGTLVPGPETIDTELALNLLRLRRMPRADRNEGGAPPRRACEKTLAEAICGKLDVLAKRRARKEAGRLTGPERADDKPKKAA